MPHVGPHPPDPETVTPLMVEGWLRNAVKGERFEYWRGCLARALADESRPLKARLNINDLRKYMIQLADEGAVTLVQKRMGPEDFSYRAVKI